MITWSFIFSIIALITSLWGRIESFYISKRQFKFEQAKKIGEALVSAQILKNTLSDYIEEVQELLKVKKNLSQEIRESYEKSLKDLKNEYENSWIFVNAFEKSTISIINGTNININLAKMEATVAHFNQRKILALYDIQYLNSINKKQINSN